MVHRQTDHYTHVLKQAWSVFHFSAPQEMLFFLINKQTKNPLHFGWYFQMNAIIMQKFFKTNALTSLWPACNSTVIRACFSAYRPFPLTWCLNEFVMRYWRRIINVRWRKKTAVWLQNKNLPLMNWNPQPLQSTQNSSWEK